MKKILEKLYIGSERDCISLRKNREDFAILHACKYHCYENQFEGKAKPSMGQSGYLWHPHNWAELDVRNLYLNMIDNAVWQFWKPLFDESMKFIDRNINRCCVFVHCNQCESRAPSMAFVYLVESNILGEEDFDLNFAKFKEDYYSAFIPGEGVKSFLERYCDGLKNNS